MAHQGCCNALILKKKKKKRKKKEKKRSGWFADPPLDIQTHTHAEFARKPPLIVLLLFVYVRKSSVSPMATQQSDT